MGLHRGNFSSRPGRYVGCRERNRGLPPAPRRAGMDLDWPTRVFRAVGPREAPMRTMDQLVTLKHRLGRYAFPKCRLVWRWAIANWRIGCLTTACLLFTMSTLRELVAVREFQGHITTLADTGGGVLFVTSPAECIRTVEIADSVAESLEPRGITVTGLIVRDGMGAEGVRLVLEMANARFPHSLVSARGTASFLGRTGTPVALRIESSGEIAVLERFGRGGLEGAVGLARRLAHEAGNKQ